MINRIHVGGNKEENKKWGENSQAEQIESALPWVPAAGNDLCRGEEGEREVGRSINETCGWKQRRKIRNGGA